MRAESEIKKLHGQVASTQHRLRNLIESTGVDCKEQETLAVAAMGLCSALAWVLEMPCPENCVSAEGFAVMYENAISEITEMHLRKAATSTGEGGE